LLGAPTILYLSLLEPGILGRRCAFDDLKANECFGSRIKHLDFDGGLDLAKRFVALLRGVNNIGATKRIAMADLRVLVEQIGFRDARTVLNSGNIVFSALDEKPGQVGTRIQRALQSRLGVNPRVTVLTGNEVAAAVQGNPFGKVADNPSHLLVMVLDKPSYQDRLKPLLDRTWAPEALALGKRVAYIWAANGVGESKLWVAVDRALEQSGTARNIRTMTKLLALVQESPT
jgi:uncharacterized protein (DUF1697 family)